MHDEASLCNHIKVAINTGTVTTESQLYHHSFRSNHYSTTKSIMLRFVLFASFATCCVASGGYGSSGGSSSGSSGYGSSLTSGSGGYGMSMGMVSMGNAGGYGDQVIPAAIHSRHQVEFRDVPSTGSINPTTIEVGANSVPLNILFRSASSNLNIQQAHDGAQGGTQETSSEDEPHRLVHSVTKPIIQEVREVITPYRKITQEIQPVQEEILTIVARGTEQNKGGYGSTSSGGSDYGLDMKGGSMKQMLSSYGGGNTGGSGSRKGY